ncbi:2',3'-cyclic-nucleotide 3'-phosphodiesterase [Rhypophila decipiens]|uniref:2',3'-cyclic-nucleotide 3'-phosphodiesterase n=1 Tax=Rhypophila decipiens TaxID=261697 RepID=A0AAN6YFM0_9PEZI|nr:2',3'-cyclic-nucleotide 3'-phosphodiesterase [Rhypophila decipiens]
MPGSSLWLLPPKSHPLHAILSALITKTLPSQFPDITLNPSSNRDPHGMDSTFFPPHMTLTSGISPYLYGSDPQAFLDSIPFPAANSSDGVKVRFFPSTSENTSIQSQETFFRRCFIKVVLDNTVRQLAGIARARGVNGEDDIGPKTEEWLVQWQREFGPHVSLIYGDVPINDEILLRISDVVEQAGVDLGGSKSGTESSKTYNGWDGGIVWLVPTDRPVNEWKPIAIREL